jgi:hypothetical protein
MIYIFKSTNKYKEYYYMTTVLPRRHYMMTDAKLYSFASYLCTVLLRDLPELSEFGINHDKINSLRADCDYFVDIAAFGETVAEISGATEEKDEKKNLVKEDIRKLALRVSMKWGAESAQYKSLNINDMNKATNDAFIAIAKNVHTRLTLYLPDLAEQGLTIDMLNSFAALIETLEEARDFQVAKKEERDLTTKLRIEKGNELYAKVTMYCEIGKRVFSYKSRSKYNDYLIYGKVKPPLPKAPVGLEYIAASKEIAWTATDHATSYQVVYKKAGDKKKFKQIYKGTANKAAFAPAPSDYIVKVRARNAKGYGEFGEELEVDTIVIN